MKNEALFQDNYFPNQLSIVIKDIELSAKIVLIYTVIMAIFLIIISPFKTMNYSKKINHVIPFTFALWFLLTGWMWVYFANLIFSYPIGIMGFFLWRRAHRADPKNLLSKITFGIYIASLLISILAVFLYR